MNMLDRIHEAMPRAELQRLQLERLQALVSRLTRHVRRYRERLGTFRPTQLSDLPKIPPTSVDDLLAAFPYGMFALPLREAIRLHAVNGPGGKPLVLGFSRNDLTHWGRLVARQLAAIGVTAHDVIQIGFTAGTFNPALGYLLGAESLEASVIPQDPFHIDQQLQMLRNYRSTVLITTPNNALDLARLLDSRCMDPQSLSLRVVLLTRCVAAEDRDRIAEGLATPVHATFGVPEVLDPGLVVECDKGHLHLNEDHFLAETDTNGELLITTLCRESMPLLRYRTRIGCVLDSETRCNCGRTGRILIAGTPMDDRLRVNEITLYPEQLKAVLRQTRASSLPMEWEIKDRCIQINLQVKSEVFSDTMRVLDELKNEVVTECFARLGIQVNVRFTNPRQGRCN